MLSVHPVRGQARRKDQAGLLVILWLLLFLPATASSQSSARLLVPDRIALPEEQTPLEAYLVRHGLLGILSPAVQGELIQFFDGADNPLGDRLTDASGLARVPFRSAHPGVSTFTARLAANPRFTADPAFGRVFIQKRACPLLFVLIEGALAPHKPMQRFFPKWEESPAAPGSREKIEKLSAAHNLVYLTLMPKFSTQEVRKWLEDKGFPLAPLVPLESGIEIEAGGEATPDTEGLEALWKDRSLSAHLVTGNRSFAEAAAGKGFRAYLIAEPLEGTPSSGKSAPAQKPSGVKVLQGWEKFEPDRSGPGSRKDPGNG